MADPLLDCVKSVMHFDGAPGHTTFTDVNGGSFEFWYPAPPVVPRVACPLMALPEPVKASADGMFHFCVGGPEPDWYVKNFGGPFWPWQRL